MIPPRAVQLLVGSERFVVASAPKTAPTLLVKLKWNEPSPSFLVSVNNGSVGTGTLTLTKLLVLWMPLTKTVASAQPGGKFQTGTELNEVAVQSVHESNRLRPLSRLSKFSTGKSLEEF